jgi:hypothetical protein
MPFQQSKIVSTSRELQSPIDLTARYAFLQRKISFPPVGPTSLGDLLAYKWSWEQERGFDALMGNEAVQLGSEELFGRLFDLQSFRGSHMLDIAVGQDETLLLFVRRIVTVTDRASRIAAEMMDQMEQIIADLRA